MKKWNTCEMNPQNTVFHGSVLDKTAILRENKMCFVGEVEQKPGAGQNKSCLCRELITSVQII